MARAAQELETDERLLALQEMARSQYSLTWLDKFVNEWEEATDNIRQAFESLRRNKS